MKERNLILIKLVVSHLLLLIGMIILSSIFNDNENSFLLLSITQSILLIVFFAGYWEFFGIKFKWIFFVSAETIIFILLINRLASGITEFSTNLWFVSLLVIQLYLLWLLGKIFTVIFKNDNAYLEIEFPFEQGLYLVTDGGNSKLSRMMNYHFHSPVHKKKDTNKSMLYATDVVKLRHKMSSFIPSTNEEYPIFNESVTSPMEGTVVKVVNDIDDNLPFSGNYPYNTGNTVVIKKDNYYFLLGHLKQASIVVEPGDFVKRKDLLGHAGNSGMSERPHLHMQLMHCDHENYWKGMGICIKYKNKNLYKNRLVKV
jgi:hypothetical protein